MKSYVMIKVPTLTEIKPGDKVITNFTLPANCQKELTVCKMIETASGIRAVFTNGTWRPMTTYNDTWKKKELF